MLKPIIAAFNRMFYSTPTLTLESKATLTDMSVSSKLTENQFIIYVRVARENGMHRVGALAFELVGSGKETLFNVTGSMCSKSDAFSAPKAVGGVVSNFQRDRHTKRNISALSLLSMSVTGLLHTLGLSSRNNWSHEIDNTAETLRLRKMLGTLLERRNLLNVLLKEEEIKGLLLPASTTKPKQRAPRNKSKTDVSLVVSTGSSAPQKRGPGRPRGSKNKAPDAVTAG